MRRSYLLAMAAMSLASVAAGRAEPVSPAVPRVGVSVDVELVLAVDVSYSMEPDELAVQREGYAEALVSPEFLSALAAGARQRIAVTYFEWSTSSDQKTIVPWRVIDGSESAAAVAAEIMRSPLRRASRTSISGAINFARHSFSESPYKGERRVLDVSGDGPNNSGEPVVVARDAALGEGIVINGLPIMTKPPSTAFDIEQLDIYYEDCVIGGRGSFSIAIRKPTELKEAIRTKLVLDVASSPSLAKLVANQALEPRIPCTIGEQRWRERWNR